MERKINCPVSDEDLNIVGNWLVSTTFHDRYYFSTSFKTYFYCSLKEVIISEEGYVDKKWDKIRGKYYPNEHNYILDASRHFEEDKEKEISRYYIDCKQIMNMDELETTGYVDFVWGLTNSKYGLLDELERGNENE